MANRIDLKKTIYTKTQYSKVINTKFSELGATSVNEDLVGESNVALFFEQYNTLFYEIPAEGDTNSHEFLVKTSGEYINFEANLPIIRHAVKYKKRVIFPSTSEVYGMSSDNEFDPDNTNLVLGPINKPRWIYSCAKQMMDRVIHAYGQEKNLQYTLFRPFNWIGSGLDSFNSSKEGSSRVITQFFGNLTRNALLNL